MNDYEKIMSDIIEEKYNEKFSHKEIIGPFHKINFFEANAVGQIGESFVKESFKKCGIRIDETPNTVHDEYDVKINDIKIEVKTARRGVNNTFQFNGLNPQYNANFIILIGITPNKLYFKVLPHESIKYVHSSRSYFCKVNESTTRKLVAMNPGNSVNFKLTLNTACLDDIDGLPSELVRIATLANANVE